MSLKPFPSVRFVALIIRGLLCLVLPACAPKVPDEWNPAWSPNGELIAYECIVGHSPFTESATSDICVVRPDGTGWQRLTTDNGSDKAPIWSPDGKEIAFISDQFGTRNVFLMRSDGSDQHRLTDQGNVQTSLAWSPDGRFIAYSAEHDSKQIYTVDVETLRITQLTDRTQGIRNFDPQWSPDGRYIAFVSDRDDNFEIYLMQPNGQGAVNVTNDPADDERPVWSPGGKRLVFESRSNVDPASVKIYSALVDELVNHGSPTAIAIGHQPTWSPDSTHLAFMSTRSDTGPDAIYSASVSGDTFTEALVVDMIAQARLAWSPDSSKIAFTSAEFIQSTSIHQIWIVNMDGSDLRRLTPIEPRP